MRPEIATYPSYFNAYIKLVAGDEIKEIISKESTEDFEFFDSITEEQSRYKYQEEKWTVKEILQHVIDAERIFGYRALAIARQESNALPGFDENDYAEYSHANNRSWSELISEFKAVRAASIHLIKSFTDDDLKRTGTVNDYHISVSAIAFTIVGHVMHHIHIIRERYLTL